MSLTFEEFQAGATPAIPMPDEGIEFWGVGLGGEVGELIEVAFALLMLSARSGMALNVCKKLARMIAVAHPGEEFSVEELDARLLKESGDILFYLEQVLGSRGYTLRDAAQETVDKLAALREAYGTQSGPC